jgi:hypothetical protein
MGKLILAVAVIAAALLAQPTGAGAHRAVIVGTGPLVVLGPPVCCSSYYPPAFVPPGFYPCGALGFSAPYPWRYRPWYYRQYFAPRTKRVYGVRFPGRR